MKKIWSKCSDHTILFSNLLDKFSTAHCAYIVKQGCPQFIPWSLQSIEKENEMVIAGGGLFAVRNEHLATDDGRYSSLHNDPNKHIIWNKRSSSYVLRRPLKFDEIS